MRITSPKIFLFIGFLITAGFIFFPKIYDPLIMSFLPEETIEKEQKLVDYLKSIQNKENIIIGVHGHTHQSPISGDLTCEYYCLAEDITAEVAQRRIKKGINVFEKLGLEPAWLVSAGINYDEKFLNIAKGFGYATQPYFLESPADFQKEVDMVLKPETAEKIKNFQDRKNKEKKEAILADFSSQELGITGLEAEELSFENLNLEELKKKIEEIKSFFGEIRSRLDDFIAQKEEHYKEDIILKEYTIDWGKEGFNEEKYNQAIVKLDQDMTTSITGILLHIEDYNFQTESFIKQALQKYSDIVYLRIDDIASNYDLPRLEKIVDLANQTDRMVLATVIPSRLAKAASPQLSGIIKTTWFVFVPFFLFPLAVMLPLHWYERREKRRSEKPIKKFSKKILLPGSWKLPKVSMILPAYNEEEFIAKSIEQSLRQDYKGELEIVVVDDGSIDRTAEIVKEYTAKYPNVKFFQHKENSGKPAALNTGFQKATGKISVFSDTDSRLDRDLVSKIIPHFNDQKVGMVAGMIIIDNEKNLLTKLQQMEYLYNQEIVRFCQASHKGVLICPGAATAVRTQIAQAIPSNERTVTEDADFTFEVLKAGWKVTQEPEAISRTDAPENWKVLISQRKRWLYGVLQTIIIHRWAIFQKGTKIPNLWVWWAWIGYITCPITTLAVIFMPLFIWRLGSGYLIFLGFYSILVGLIYGFAHWYGLKQYRHENKQKLIFLLPFYMVYQYLLNLLLFYLVLAFVFRKGITVRYGGRDIHAL